MEIINQFHEAASVLLARIFLGLLFFFQGYDAVFNVKVKNVIETYRNTFTNKGIPYFILVFASWFTCYVELVGGIFLILGLFKYVALYLLGTSLIIASIGFGIHTPMWDTRHVLPRFLLLLFLLSVPQAWDIWLLDTIVKF